MGLGFYGQYTTIKKLGTSPTRSGEVADQGVRMLCTNVTQIPNFIPFLCGTCKVAPPKIAKLVYNPINYSYKYHKPYS
jgi:hypothetical protein